jgi:transcriptional regulator PpsR
MQLIKRAPDAVIMVNRDGKILKANRAFLDLVQVSSQALVEGQSLSRWLGRPGADMRVLLGSVVQQGAVRLFSTTIQGEIGISTEVEISAIGNDDKDPQRIGLVLRDIGSRLPAADVSSNDLGHQLSELSSQVGTSPLRQLVKETVSVLENHYIQEALKMSGGNRTAAAEILGISRQSLYAKLNRYGLSTGADE